MSKLNISRRDFLKAAGVSAAALGLTACGGSSSSTAASGSASAAGSTASAGGSNWPTDTVSFYVPAKAGGGTDMTARVFLQGINEVHPGNYIVVNDVTGGGTVAAENVRNAKPDGLNLLAYHTGLCTSIASGQYAHDLSEFTICGMFITVPDEATGGLFVPGNSKFDKLEDLIAYGKEHPGELMAGMQNGSSTQLIEALFEKEFDFQATMVDAGSNADKVTALMGNQIDYCFMNTTGNDQYVQMHRWMPLYRLRSAPLCPTGLRRNSSAGCPVFAATGKASWNRPRRYQMCLHLVARSAPVQKILRFWCPSCPASWLFS